jgi:hypothetical protein
MIFSRVAFRDLSVSMVTLSIEAPPFHPMPRVAHLRVKPDAPPSLTLSRNSSPETRSLGAM